MKIRQTAALLADDDIDRFFVQFILFTLGAAAGVSLIAVTVFGFDFDVDQFVNKILFAGANGVGDIVDLVIAEEGSLTTQHGAGSWPKE